MNVLYLTIIISSLMGAGFVVAFIWSVKTGQFEEIESNAITVLEEDKPLKRKRNE